MPVFYRFRDVTIYWSKICVFRRFTRPISFEALAKRFFWELGYESSKKLESMGYLLVKTA